MYAGCSIERGLAHKTILNGSDERNEHECEGVSIALRHCHRTGMGLNL